MGARRFVLTAAVFTLLAAPGLGKADIIHRYSFNGDATDSVGGADGVLMGGAQVDSSQLQLDGVDSYVSLPISRDLGVLTNCTIEGWATWNLFQNPWSRIFDFGNGPLENMFLTPRNGSNNTLRYAITIGGSGGEEQTESFFAFPVGVSTHFAVVIDADFGMTTLYVNGRPQAIEFGPPLTPSDLTAPTMGNYLGKSQYADPFFSGSIDEFRIYNNALSAADIMASYQAGPDAP